MTADANMRVRIIQIIKENTETYSDLLIAGFDERYPNTEVTRLPMSERKALIRTARDRLFAAIENDDWRIAGESVYFPHALPNSMPSAQRAFLNWLENDFFQLDVLLRLVWSAMDTDEDKLAATRCLIRGHKNYSQANAIDQLDMLQRRAEIVFAEEVTHERSKALRDIRKNLVYEVRRLQERTTVLSKACDKEDAEIKSLVASVKCLEDDLVKAVVDPVLEVDERDYTCGGVGRLKEVFSEDVEEEKHVVYGGGFSNLSDRELDVVERVIQGKSNKEIAEDLVISEFTVKNHLRKVFQKLQLTNRTQLAAFGAHRKAVEISLPQQDTD